MTRAAKFLQADAERAMKAAVKAGLPPSECVIREGEIRLIFSDATAGQWVTPLDEKIRKLREGRDRDEA